MVISDKQIQEIIDKTDMVGLVSEYVTLTKRGKNYFGLCPFHDDKKPSFSVSPEKKIAKCMSCGEGGNPINFLRKIKHISFEEAATELANKVGVKLENVKTYQKEDPNKHYYELNSIAKDFYQQFLFNSNSGKVALEYLNKRGLSLETIKAFGIGLAPKEHNTLVKIFKDKGYSEIDASDLGLIKNGQNGYYDTFNNRIMFPIIDDYNRCVGFSGRIYYESATEPKYVNSEETPIFKKGEMLYNLNNAIPAMRKMGRVILCEGQMDVISVTNAGIKECICSLGTALTIDQVKLLSKYIKNVIICYDGDGAGLKATKKAFNLLKGFKTSALVLPNKMDPDEFVKKYGNKALIDFVNNKQKDILEFFYYNAFNGKNLNISFEYEQVKKEVFDFLKPLQSTALVEKFLRKLANDLKISFEAIFNDYSSYKAQNNFNPDLVIENKPKEFLPLEIDFLAFNFLNQGYYHFFRRNLGEVENYLRDEIIQEIYTTIDYLYRANVTSSSELISQVNKEYPQINDLGLLNKILESMEKIENMDAEKINMMLDDSITRFELQENKRNLSDLTIKTNDATEENLELLEKKLALKRKTQNKRK